MWRGGAGLLAAVLALTGCKSTDPKPNDRDPAGTPASRTKGAETPKPAGRPWIDDVGADGGGTAGGQDPAAPDCLAGRVVDAYNRPVQNVFVQVEPVNPPPGTAGAAGQVGLYTDAAGAFYTRGLKPGKPYSLTADAGIEGKRYTAAVQTLVPNARITLVLRDDQQPAVGILKGAGQADAGDRIPPPNLTGPMPKPTDGSWSPGADGSQSLPTTIAPGRSPIRPTQPGGTIPPPDDLAAPGRPVARPENVAEAPTKWVSPPVAIPGPTLPPTYPNPVPPPPSPPPPSLPPAGMGQAGTGFILADPFGRSWEFPANRSGSVVLVEFMTTQTKTGNGFAINAPCLAVVPILTDLQARYASDGLQVIAVACDEWLDQKHRAEAAARYVRDNNLNYPVFVEPGDVPGGVRDRYNVQGYPTAVLLDAAGKVLWQGHPNLGRGSELEAAVKRALAK
jgi:thiol-disulfide isomerase/thioredoxin